MNNIAPDQQKKLITPDSPASSYAFSGHDIFQRTRMLIGQSGLDALARAHVCVFGLGGVGGHATEALARAGLGQLTIVDKDVVDATNINRQVIATHKTLGCAKVDVMSGRIASINPACKVHANRTFVRANTAYDFDFSQFDYVVDAVDTVTAKLCIIEAANATRTPAISSMGMGNKLDPTKIQVADIANTHTCALARIMRKELRKRNIHHLKCVFSAEKPIEVAGKRPAEKLHETVGRHPAEKSLAHPTQKPPLGSISFVPSTAGMIIASVVVRDLIEKST